MKRNTIKFSGKTISLALFFVVFLFGNLTAADRPGCQDNDGCGTSSTDAFNSSPYTAPTYAPSWTTVTTSGRVKGGQYLRFSVVEGEVYSWSTEGEEDVFYGSASSGCSTDNNCYTSSDKTENPYYYGLRCVGGYCLLLFDTELTLLKGGACNADAEFLAYSNSGGFGNQSQLDWKATFTGTVTLLVTNYEYDNYNDTFVGCRHTNDKVASEGGMMTNTSTTVKWQRTAAEPCTTCGEKTKYFKDQSSVSASKAPLWTTIQSREAVNLLDFLPTDYSGTTNSPNDLWLKPGSYVVFNVTENQIYRWSTCVADFQDTQLTLFKGDRGSVGGDGDSCGEVLAYGDDSKVSYTKKLRDPDTGGVYIQDETNGDILETYCPTGTKQTVIEWQANFTGKVTLLLNEYNCYQCYPTEIVQPGVTYNNWLNCFYEVTGQFKTDADHNFIMDNGWPVEAASDDTNKMPGTFVYPFPLEWQRYDCDTCTGSKVATIGDTGDTGVTDFESGSWLGFNEGNYAEFYLTRGSKYLFQTTDPDAVITIRRGAGCTGELVAQATGKITYFAESDYDNSTRKYKSDIISVFVSNADCRTGANTMKYSYYGGDSGSVKSRYTSTQIGNDKLVTDSMTGLQFVDLGKWTRTWKEAMQACGSKTVGGEDTEEELLQCPPPVCPSGKYDDGNPANNEYFCKYISSVGNSCPAPACDSGYAEFKKTDANKDDPDLKDLFGKCYNNTGTCDSTYQSAMNLTNEDYYSAATGLKCKEHTGDQYIAAKAKCATCYRYEGYTLTNTGTSLRPNWKCVKDICKEDNSCITIGGSCSYIAVGCPDGYVEDPITGQCYDAGAGELVNAVPVADAYDATVDPDYDHYGIDTTSAVDTCLPGSYYDNNLGKCQIIGCGQYTNYNRNFTRSSNPNYTGGNAGYLKNKSLCYMTESEAKNNSGVAVPCCCESNIFVRGGTSTIIDLMYDEEHTVRYMAGNGGNFLDLTCEEPENPPCEEGAVFVPQNGQEGQCAKCSDSGNVLYERRVGLMGCRPDCENYIEVTAGDTIWQICLACYDGDQLVQDDSGNWKCVKCAEGRTPELIGDSFMCVKECDFSNHLEKDGYCYPVLYGEQCKDGWVKIGDKCRKWQLDSSDNNVYVKCDSTIAFKNNDNQKQCDETKPNSYDCDCFKDRCEDITRPQDAKVCPDPYQVCYKYKLQYGQEVCDGYYTYHPDAEYTTDSTTGYRVVDTCRYSDMSGQTCGKAMGGWVLPNINQLYSIVDFDLYDAATTYPFSSNGYSRTESYATCEPVADPAEDIPCTTNEECEEENDDWFCFRNKCKSSDPYGDNQCGGNDYLCIDNKCVRNNWYWSSTTVVRENTADARYVWAVNMQDGRSYFAKKGCDGNECTQEVDLNARAHHVLCVKGSSFAGIFDSDAPTLHQTFSGWVCDKDDPGKILSVYFGIVDKDGKNVVDLKYTSDSDDVKVIPGLDQKGIFYGSTDDSLITDDKSSEIYYNCGFDASNGIPHAFGVQWRTDSVTAGKEDIAAIITGIKTIECSTARIQDENDPKEDCAYPPYFVTAYGVDSESSTATAVPISPESRPFVFTNRCGDDYKTNDGTYEEDCESDEFANECVYGDDACQLCAATNMGSIKACTYYNATPERCMDGILQSQYCVENEAGNLVVEDGHVGAGLPCEFYNFKAHNIESSSEECDCKPTDPNEIFFLYPESGDFNCADATPLTQAVCPSYYVVPDGQTYDKNAEDAACYICDGCKKSRVLKPRCGDGKINRSDSCDGYDSDSAHPCIIVPRAEEECDNGGQNSDTGSCTTKCKLGTCGDGFIQASLDEVCDSGAKNGWYETNCTGTMACPGCASITCGKPDEDGNLTDSLGPRCGDGIVQNRNECSTKYSELGFSSVEDCQTKLTGAEEVCDLGVDGQGKSLNGTPVPFSKFLDTSEGSDCAEVLNGVRYPVSAIHPKFLECVYKYQQFLADPANSGCAKDCKAAQAPYCGDGERTGNEKCDDGLPEVTLYNGKYVISANYDDDGENYNGKKIGSCRLDCMGKYDCQNDIVETEKCVDVTADGFCPKVGEDDGKKLYVKNGNEECDDGQLTGTYGYCDYGCQTKAYCGSGGELNCIKEENGSCKRKEECDFSEEGNNPNKTIDLAYSDERYGSCIAENENCTKGIDKWKDEEGKDIICCQYGRYCGDGTVDNGSKVGDSVDWKNKDNWHVVAGNATVKYDARNLSLRFELTASTATMELDADIPIDLKMRYLLEFNMMPLKVGGEIIGFQGGVNQYDASGTLLTTTENHQNKSPYFFVTVEEPSDSWRRGKNAAPIKGESTGGTNTWYTGTKKVHIIFKMDGAVGTQFLVRALTFYDIDHVNYSGSIDSSHEMCDPGTENFVDSSNSYMTDCTSECKWTNYCGDGKIQRSECGTPGDDYFPLLEGQTCVGGIANADEICDNATNTADTYNGCEPGCQKRGPYCGDGRVDKKSCPTGSEETCHTPSGGNFTTDEMCDAGTLNSNTPVSGLVTKSSNYNTCRTDCRPSRCGDGILDTVVIDDGSLEGKLVEECDCGTKGDEGTRFGDTANQSTTVNGETKYLCIDDNGKPLYNTVSAERAALCRPNCKISRCGDGIKDKGEECDDGNFNDHDSCTSQCKFNVVGDGIWAHSRSYLCEELLGKKDESTGTWSGISEAQMKKMRDRGVVDCVDSGDTMTCAKLAEELTSYAKIKTYFESNVLHCCYNQKLGGGADDKNCEYEDQDGNDYTPKDLAIKRCEKYAENVSGDDNTTIRKKTKEECIALVDANEGQYAAIEQCELCLNETCGKTCETGDTKCKNRQKLNCSTKYSTQTEIDACIERNKYCSPTSGWNIVGRCGDGKVDESAGEKCDNSTNDENFYDDLYGGRWITPGNPWQDSFDDGHRWYNGKYCTGECEGNCTEKSPMCGSGVSSNCWKPGCTKALHGDGYSTDISQCGDGKLDTYAGEECDYGVSSHSDDWTKSYCNFQCKFNRQYSGGLTAKCGDGKIQSMTGEKCDDGNDSDNDYCVGDGSTDSNGYANHCKIFYGSCGDGNITGPGYSLDPLSNYSCTREGGCAKGPEDCDIKKNADNTYTGDARSTSLVNALVNVEPNFDMNTICANCKRVGSCGDNLINPRFESCDFGGNNATENVTLDGETCFAGCKSNPKGGFIKASNAELKGWACDPDHPMTHPESLVRIEIYDSLYESCKTSHPSDYATACADHYVGVKTIATTIDIFVTGVNVIKECGGGSKHGWTYDPSKSDAAMNWTGKTGPYTVEAYATSLDGSPETEVFLGKKTFASAMNCGDNYISQCSSIEVVKSGETEATGWAHNQICCDDDETHCPENGVKVDGKCADVGLENKKACIDEQCDNGNNNGDDKDCNSKCKWTYCGDNQVQANATGEPDPRPGFLDKIVVAYEECESSQTHQCGCDPNDNNNCFPPRLQQQGTISGTATCSASECKWNKNSCKILSSCPALSTAIKSSWNYTDDNGTHKYDPDKASTYIQYNGTDNYTRFWNGTSWGTAESESKYAGLSGLTTQESSCSFTCKPDFAWDGTRCKPQDKPQNCELCPNSAGEFAIWTPGPDGLKKKCNREKGSPVARTITQTANLDINGDVNYNPKESDITPKYSETYEETKCNWSCDEDQSVYDSTNKKCLPKASSHPCTGKPNDKGFVWISVTVDSSNNIHYTEKGESMEISTSLDIDSNSETYLKYVPTDEQLVALDINNTDPTSQSPANLKAAGKLKSQPVRCYYGCPADTVYKDGYCKTTLCGDGIVSHSTCEGVDGTCLVTPGADELCDDGGNEGTHWKGTSVQTKSHCDRYCGSYTRCLAANNNDASKCSFIKANGYNGRIKSNSGDGYYCGDGKVQIQGNPSDTNGCKTGELNCLKVSSSYSNMSAGIIDLNSASEECDPNDSANSITTLCNRAGVNGGTTPGSGYYPVSGDTMPECTVSCTISNADKNSGCNYCGDGVWADRENCGEGDNENYYNGNIAKGRCAAAFNPSNNTTYSINIPGVYCFTVKGGDGNKGDADNACGGATVSGCYKLLKGDVVTFRVGSVGETRPSDSSSVCAGTYGGGGGGGASWVYLTRSGSNTLLLVAGGGGGGGYYSNTSGDNTYKTCGGGSGNTSANNNTSNTADNCTDNGASDGAAVTASNFANSSTTGAGGDGGYHYTTKCSGEKCDSKFACGGGGGGYSAGGAKGTKDFGGGGGGSYVNTNTTYYSTGSSMTAGSNYVASPSGGSITVKKPNSNATCSNCQWSTTYSACN